MKPAGIHTLFSCSLLRSVSWSIWRILCLCGESLSVFVSMSVRITCVYVCLKSLVASCARVRAQKSVCVCAVVCVLCTRAGFSNLGVEICNLQLLVCHCSMGQHCVFHTKSIPLRFKTHSLSHGAINNCKLLKMGSHTHRVGNVLDERVGTDADEEDYDYDEDRLTSMKLSCFERSLAGYSMVSHPTPDSSSPIRF